MYLYVHFSGAVITVKLYAAAGDNFLCSYCHRKLKIYTCILPLQILTLSVVLSYLRHRFIINIKKWLNSPTELNVWCSIFYSHYQVKEGPVCASFLGEGESSLEERCLVAGLGRVYQGQKLLHQVVDLEWGPHFHSRETHHLILCQCQKLGAMDVLE